MPHEFRVRRVVEFCETDMAGIVHFSNFFRYMEFAEHEFFRSLGFTLHRQSEGRMEGWARVHAECTYRLPLVYPDHFEIHGVVEQRSSHAVTYRMVFRRLAAGEGEAVEVARGRMKTVFVTRASGQPLKATRIPEAIARHLEEAPRQAGEVHDPAGSAPEPPPGWRSP